MLRQIICCLAFVLCLEAIAVSQESSAIPVARVSFIDPAYIGMPIWMTVDSATGFKIHYPSSTTPNDFYCNEVEIQQDGRQLKPVIGSPPAGRAGPACGWLGIAGISESRLPIHLQYSLNEPGTYKIRFTRRMYRSGKPEIAEQSEWTPLHLEFAPPQRIEHWLDESLATVPAAPGALLGDALPSLLASRDVRVLNVMLEKTYDADSVVASYAANSLVFFDKGQVRAHVLSMLRARARCRGLVGHVQLEELDLVTVALR